MRRHLWMRGVQPAPRRSHRRHWLKNPSLRLAALPPNHLTDPVVRHLAQLAERIEGAAGAVRSRERSVRGALRQGPCAADAPRSLLREHNAHCRRSARADRQMCVRSSTGRRRCGRSRRAGGVWVIDACSPARARCKGRVGACTRGVATLYTVVSRASGVGVRCTGLRYGM